VSSPRGPGPVLVARGRRALAVIDGEHYADVVVEALATLPYEVVGAVLVGGTEKLRGGEEYGVPVAGDVVAAVREWRPDVVYDLSDEPVLGPQARFLLASRVLALGVPYEGPGFRFDPPRFEPFERPSIAIIGTGKRVGKTAVAGHAARVLGADREVVVVAMGRGGPPEPEVADAPPSVADLLARSRDGRHAASDYLEDAALSGIVTVGARRAGGGLAGQPGVTNVLAAAELAAARSPDLVLFEGSGAALPPVAAEARILVASANQPGRLVAGYLNAYRILISDLVVLTMAEAGTPVDEVRDAILEVAPEMAVVPTIMRPRPISDVRGRRAAYFSTSSRDALPLLTDHLREQHGVDIVHASNALARRDELQRELAATDAEVFLVELKAAAIDVVAEAAVARGAELVLVANDVFPVGGVDLDTALRALADAVTREAAPA
jgi:cyclic 2,3-diphosphoglycerate synthetase